VSDGHIVVLGAEAGPRVAAFQSGLARLRRPQADVLSYQSFLESPGRLAALLSPGAWLRFDSPDRDPAALLALYRAGERAARSAGYPALTPAEASGVVGRKGPLGSVTQLFFGLCAALRQAADIAAQAGAIVSHPPEEIALAYDKAECTRHLAARAIAGTRALDNVTGFDSLVEAARARRARRVFVKLRYGSSAAAMVALAMGPDGRMLAHATAELAADGAIWITRDVRRVEQIAHIAALVDALARHGIHVEAWLPKAGIDNMTCDLRIIVVDGEPVFHVLRMSRHPMTNLHLGGRRSDSAALRARMAPGAWDRVLATCRAVARAFPGSFALGIDLAVLADLRSHAVLEVNAFGDHIKNVCYNGCTTQEWQILKWQGRTARA
jgi:hypothetical protein